MTKKYIGTKIVTAWPQVGSQKVRICGVDCKPGDEHCNGYCTGEVDHAPEVAPPAGYAVKYEDGYTSWSPKAVFEEAYRAIEREGQALTFGDALHMLKLGKKVARAGWNGKGMFLFLVPGSVFKVNRPPLLGIYAEGTEVNYHAHIDMKTADGQVVPWLCSQTDALAEDWTVVE